MGNNSVRFRFEWDIIGTVKSIIGSTSSFLHNLSSFSYRVDTGRALGELSCVIAIIVVAAFSLCGADDSETEDALLVLMTASAECPPSIDPPKNASPFRDRCRAIAEQYDLSPREAEVFTCLAKGRNAEYIHQKLFISSNTAKTHITHIYRKMEINSQQRLIDLVDREEQPPTREERAARNARGDREAREARETRRGVGEDAAPTDSVLH